MQSQFGESLCKNSNEVFRRINRKWWEIGVFFKTGWNKHKPIHYPNKAQERNSQHQPTSLNTRRTVFGFAWNRWARYIFHRRYGQTSAFILYISYKIVLNIEFFLMKVRAIAYATLMLQRQPRSNLCRRRQGQNKNCWVLVQTVQN